MKQLEIFVNARRDAFRVSKTPKIKKEKKKRVMFLSLRMPCLGLIEAKRKYFDL